MSDKIFFFVDPHNISENNFFLNEKESHHLTKVLRKPIGTEIWLTDGIGKAYCGIFQNIQNEVVGGTIQEVFPKYGENKIQIDLGIGILKKDKINLVVEKATECGINEIVPLVLDKCIKRDIYIDRLIKISKSAVKQCGRSVSPSITKPLNLEELLNTSTNKSVLVCHESGENGIDVLPEMLKNNTKILLIVGPEGDFSKEEISFLKEKKVTFINLGNRRLRSETAVIVALSQINMYNN
jgi:16S rRNA (uracil1498-N3)-methyltransferase